MKKLRIRVLRREETYQGQLTLMVAESLADYDPNKSAPIRTMPGVLEFVDTETGEVTPVEIIE